MTVSKTQTPARPAPTRALVPQGTAGPDPAHPVLLAHTRPGSLLVPCAEDEVLVEQFKRYISLRDRLCENTDYVWSVAFVGPTGDEDRKFFAKREKAETFLAAIRARKLEGDLEKKIKKSGALKLGKAFGISQEVVEEVLDRDRGTAYYRVRATAPNGQTMVRTGSSDRNERGKKNSPFDTLMATALTRAADRAIMALLGGETTAEEYDGGDEVPAPAPATEPVGPPMAHGEALGAIDAKFVKTSAAKADSPRMQYNRALWKAAGALYGLDAERMVNNTIQRRYNVDSVTKLTDEQFKTLSEGVTGLALRMGKL